jgi:hypothetical protein
MLQICDMGQMALLPLQRRAVDFFRPKNPTASAGFKPPKLLQSLGCKAFVWHVLY